MRSFRPYMTRLVTSILWLPFPSLCRRGGKGSATAFLSIKSFFIPLPHAKHNKMKDADDFVNEHELGKDALFCSYRCLDLLFDVRCCCTVLRKERKKEIKGPARHPGSLSSVSGSSCFRTSCFRRARVPEIT